MSTDNIKAITDSTTTDIERLIIILKARDILFEGDVPFLTASIIEYHYEKLEELLIENGYNGGKLVPIFSDGNEAKWKYALFDSEHIGAEIAMKMVRHGDGEN